MKAGIALGSNLGDREAHLQQAFSWLHDLSTTKTVLSSPLIESSPVDCPPDSRAFLNAVAEIHYKGTPEQLLNSLQDLEKKAGRPSIRTYHAPRVLDLDLLYFGPIQMETPQLILPHPRLAQRRFVLEPLAAIRSDLILPGYQQTIAELLALLAPKDGNKD